MRIIFSLFFLLLANFLCAQPPGSLDPSFGTGGKVITSLSPGQDKAYGVAIQPDGKIVVAGLSVSTITGQDFACMRYKTDGTPDSTFGNAGIVTTDIQLGSDDGAYSLALQTDGKIVLAGYSDDGSNRNAAIVRYKTDGSPDSTFGNNGKVLTDFDNAYQDEIRVVKIHDLTGNIIVGGSATITSTTSKPVVARYLSNGNRDSTFNSNGIRLLWITSLDYQYLFSVEDLVVQSNGKISAVGWRDFPGLQWDSDYWACRINSNGTMDNTFSTDGVNVYNGTFNGHDRAYSLLLKSSGNFTVGGGGYLSTINYDCTAFEINSGGSIASWSVTADFGSSLDDIAYGLGEDLNGSFVLGGSSGNLTTKSFAITRALASGTADNTFGTNGKVTTTFGNALNECFDIRIQSDNKIVAVGYTGSDFAIARYIGTGQPQLDNFQLVTPPDQSTNQNFSNLSFNWTDAYLATSYEFEIDSSQTFSANPQTTTVSASTTVVPVLQQLTDYFWRVRASDGTNWGQWSATWKFTTKQNIPIALNPDASDQIAVFPNPATDFIQVCGADNLPGKQLRLYDLSGKKVKEATITHSTFNISVSDLQPGVYFLKIGNEESRIFRIVRE